MSLISGSPTLTGWKRRSSAASFSMCLRYSSRVVAPTRAVRRGPASASAGWRRRPRLRRRRRRRSCAARRGRGRSGPPPPATSPRTAFSRSSNSPRYFAPARSVPMSSAITRRSRRLSGTSPSTIRWASPSTIAVLPTPGSPISTGLFFLRRERTWITRRISSSRPITGSRFPARASAVRSRPNFSSAWTLSSASGEVTWCGPWTSATASASELPSGRRSAIPERFRPGRAADGSMAIYCRRASPSPSRPAAGSREGSRRRAPRRPRAELRQLLDRPAAPRGERGDVDA